MATYSSILAWRIPWTEEPGDLCLWGQKELDLTERFPVVIYGCESWTVKKVER